MAIGVIQIRDDDSLDYGCDDGGSDDDDGGAAYGGGGGDNSSYRFESTSYALSPRLLRRTL